MRVTNLISILSHLQKHLNQAIHLLNYAKQFKSSKNILLIGFLIIKTSNYILEETQKNKKMSMKKQLIKLMMLPILLYKFKIIFQFELSMDKVRYASLKFKIWEDKYYKLEK